MCHACLRLREQICTKKKVPLPETEHFKWRSLYNAIKMHFGVFQVALIEEIIIVLFINCFLWRLTNLLTNILYVWTENNLTVNLYCFSWLLSTNSLLCFFFSSPLTPSHYILSSFNLVSAADPHLPLPDRSRKLSRGIPSSWTKHSHTPQLLRLITLWSLSFSFLHVPVFNFTAPKSLLGPPCVCTFPCSASVHISHACSVPCLCACDLDWPSRTRSESYPQWYTHDFWLHSSLVCEIHSDHPALPDLWSEQRGSS